MPEKLSIEDQAKLEYLKALEAKEQYLKYNKIEALYLDEGAYRRELYPRHVEFMNKGSEHGQRAFIAANRSGKTLTGAFEMVCHLTGIYPHWWKGKVFKKPIRAWAASINWSDTKGILQEELVGDLYDPGSGLIPKHLLDTDRLIRLSGATNTLQIIYVKHSSGGYSTLEFKAYKQGPESFQGRKISVIWLDEEPKDPKIYTECLTRTVDEHEPGIIYCTFTPLFGISEVVQTFLPMGQFPPGGVHPNDPDKFVTRVGWDEVPHISEKQKETLLNSYPKHERAARTKGLPYLGSGAIYPYLEEDITVAPFEIPSWWPRAYGLDVGWKMTAAIWGAMDPDSGTVYIYSEHFAGEQHPALHASSIKGRGDWIVGAIDPRSTGSSQADGQRVIDLYYQEGLILELADNAVEAGILKCGQMFEAGRLKIFTSCQNLISEYRIYARDDKGKVIKQNDHGLDAMRYLVMTGLDFARTKPEYNQETDEYSSDDRDEYTGY